VKQLSQQAKESSVSPVVGNNDMEFFEELATDGANEKPFLWFTYVDETFVTWKCGPENLQVLLCHINNLSRNIKFTTEGGV
jgi:hypothetical protein